MPLDAGQTLAHYEILGPLGAGAMGEVYRGRDTRLEREVAIKVLPEEFAQDEERLQRFAREAKSLASLHHTHVAGIFGLEEQDDVCFLALELVPGEDLATRLARGPLPVDEAIDICRQIAEGMEAAHEAGVVHRDLKPANVRITPDGIAKVLDFGLAKPASPDGGESGASTAKTDSFLMTREGVVLGTPTYMSPEQARGRQVDRRTDIWAFGCVLYECLTGKRIFAGDSLTDVLSCILKEEPDWSALPPVPVRVRELLQRTLTKDPRRRLRDMGEARVALELAAGEPIGSPEPAGTSGVRPRTYAAAAAIGATLLAVGFALGSGSSGAIGFIERIVPPVHAQVHTFEPSDNARAHQISPDGASFAWFDDEGIWIRPLDETEATLLVAGKVDQFRWSPDSQEVAFLRELATWRVSATGGRPESISGGDVTGWTYWNWLRDGRLVYGTATRVWTVSPEDGQQEVLLELEGNPASTHWHLIEPLPDGRILGMLHELTDQLHKIELFSEDGRTTVFEAPGVQFQGMVWTDANLLVYAAETDDGTSIWSIPLSLDEGRPLGDARVHLRDADQPSIARDGTLAYVKIESRSGDEQLAWLDLEEPEPSFLGEPQQNLREASLSRDGKQIAFISGNLARATVSVHDLDRGLSTPVAQREGLIITPVWMHDGRLAVSSFDPPGAFAYSPAGRGEAEHVSEELLFGISPDGQYYWVGKPGFDFDTVVSRVVGPGPDGEELDFFRAEHDDRLEAFSPDGKWMLYSSKSSGTRQMYLASFPPTDGDARPVCVGDPQGAWFRMDMTAIYYVAANPDTRVETIHRVTLSLHPEVALGTPEEVRELEPDVKVTDYDGDRRFLVISGQGRGTRRAFVYTDWLERARRR